MITPDDRVVPFPGAQNADLRHCALRLANAARLAEAALAEAKAASARLTEAACAGCTLAEEAAHCTCDIGMAAQAEQCRTLSRQLAAI